MRAPMKIAIPSVLHAYTRGERRVDAVGGTLAELLADLDVRYPGIRFRMVNEAGALRPHMRIFVNREAVADLDRPVANDDEIVILHALSGG
jgi:molybdopterin converting factor small subunit